MAERHDPGPVPAAVEPDPHGRESVIVVSPRTAIVVTQDYRRSGLVGLTVIASPGDAITAALPAPSVDALLEALAAASAPEHVPPLPEVEVIR